MLGIGTGLLHLDVKPFQPNDVSSLEAHFSSNYGLLLTGTANGEVRRWSDISGNNYRLEPYENFYLHLFYNSSLLHFF